MPVRFPLPASRRQKWWIIRQEVVDYPGVIARHVHALLRDALADTPVVLVNGARQVGKSTLVRDPAGVGAGRRYLTLDDPGVLAAARRDPVGFVEGLAVPTTLDEIQLAPELLPAIKMAIDRRREPGRFILTGSADVLLLPKASESLAGRMEILTMWPFSQGEVEGRREGFVDDLFGARPRWVGDAPAAMSRDEVMERAMLGGYPPVVSRTGESRRRAWFESYLTTLLQRDIRELTQVADVTAVPRLMAVLATRVGGLLNVADLSRSLALPQSTLRRYFALLEATFLVQVLRPWSANLGQRLIQTPKVYLADTGLVSHLLGLNAERLDRDPTLAGALLENFVWMELRKQAGWGRERPTISFWRTASGQEVDLVLEDRSGRVVGIEVKAGATLGGGDVRGLQAMAAAVGKRWHRGVVLHTGSTVIPFASNLHGVPISCLWRS